MTVYSIPAVVGIVSMVLSTVLLLLYLRLRVDEDEKQHSAAPEAAANKTLLQNKTGTSTSTLLESNFDPDSATVRTAEMKVNSSKPPTPLTVHDLNSIVTMKRGDSRGFSRSGSAASSTLGTPVTPQESISSGLTPVTPQEPEVSSSGQTTSKQRKNSNLSTTATSANSTRSSRASSRLSQESQILLRAKTNSNASVFSSASVKLSTSGETDADHASKEDGAHEEASTLRMRRTTMNVDVKKQSVSLMNFFFLNIDSLSRSSLVLSLIHI